MAAAAPQPRPKRWGNKKSPGECPGLSIFTLCVAD
jgi:hypothetical protein